MEGNLLIDHVDGDPLRQRCAEKPMVVYMEMAKFGDFYHEKYFKLCAKDEVLARTYFKQLVEGVEALHSAGFAHLNLSLTNLMLSADY
mmetsp:Transcript_67609/g.94026  ORF Transcript_67609/g.94026 Transcript_67609/m.94026 type:complete len:88 (-) Transcript_67609:548-811(-)